MCVFKKKSVSLYPNIRLLERDEWDKLSFRAIELRIFLIKTTECRKAKQRIIGVVAIDSYVITEYNKIKIDHYEKVHLFSFTHGTARHTAECECDYRR